MYAESNVTSCIYHKLGICTLTDPRVGFQAHDRYRKSCYSPHTSEVQYAYVQYSLLYHTLGYTQHYSAHC